MFIPVVCGARWRFDFVSRVTVDVHFWHRHTLLLCGEPVGHERSGLFLDSSSASLACVSAGTAPRCSDYRKF